MKNSNLAKTTNGNTILDLLEKYNLFIDQLKDIPQLNVTIEKLKPETQESIKEFEDEFNITIPEDLKIFWLSGFANIEIADKETDDLYSYTKFVDTKGSKEAWKISIDSANDVFYKNQDLIESDANYKETARLMIVGIPLHEDEEYCLLDSDIKNNTGIRRMRNDGDPELTPIAPNFTEYFENWIASGCFQYGNAEKERFDKYWKLVKKIVPVKIASKDNGWLQHLDRWYHGNILTTSKQPHNGKVKTAPFDKEKSAGLFLSHLNNSSVFNEEAIDKLIEFVDSAEIRERFIDLLEEEKIEASKDNLVEVSTLIAKQTLAEAAANAGYHAKRAFDIAIRYGKINISEMITLFNTAALTMEQNALINRTKTTMFDDTIGRAYKWDIYSIHCEQGVLLSGLNEFEHASTAFENAIKYVDGDIVKDIRAHFNYANLLITTRKEISKALTLLDKAETLDPEADSVEYLPQILKLKGEALFINKKYKEASACLSKAVNLSPDELGFQTFYISCLTASETDKKKMNTIVDRAKKLAKKTLGTSEAYDIVLHACLESACRNKEQAIKWLSKALKTDEYKNKNTRTQLMNDLDFAWMSKDQDYIDLFTPVD